MKSFKIVFLVLLGSLMSLTSCNQGNTDGGTADTTPGTPLISSGPNSAASLTIRADTDIPVGSTADFLVEARDANGAPLPFVPITCFAEPGVALIDSGGLTSAGGVFSGVLGGSAPGSFIVECRGPASSGLVVRMGFRVTGPAPLGFTGFDGVAESTILRTTTESLQVEEIAFNDVLFRTVSGVSQVGEIDTTGEENCDGNLAESFTNDFAVFNLSNNRSSAIQIDTITYSVQGVVTSNLSEISQVVIPANSAGINLEALFTSSNLTTKQYAGTNVEVTDATANVAFTITGSNVDGSEPFTLSSSASIVADNYDLCP